MVGKGFMEKVASRETVMLGTVDMGERAKAAEGPEVTRWTAGSGASVDREEWRVLFAALGSEMNEARRSRCG